MKIITKVIFFYFSLLILLPGNAFASQSYKVTGNSMYPTLKDGDTVTISNQEKIADYKDGDVVIAKLKSGKLVIKRIQGSMLVGDNKSGSLNIPLSDVASLLGKVPINSINISDKEEHDYSEVFALGVKEIALGENHTLAITDTGSLYAWGRNDKGQLGISLTASKLTPFKVPVLEGIKQASAGINYSLALTDKGEVYGWGLNTSGQLGISNLFNTYNPTKTTFPEGTTIIKVVAGKNHSAAITDKGEVFLWGYSGNGKTGLSAATSNPIPFKLDFTEKVKDLVLGESNTLLLTENGDVYTFGANEYGQLGNGTYVSVDWNISKIKLEAKVKQITSYNHHSFALVDTGSVYAWGLNTFGQLGINTTTNKYTPTLVTALDGKNIVKIVAGQVNSAALTANGDVYTWGDTSSGQSGISVDRGSTQLLKPEKVPSLGDIKDITVGTQNGVAMTKTGDIYVWGFNTSGQLGLGDNAFAKTPTLLSLSNFFNVNDFNYAISGAMYLAEDSPIPEGFRRVGKTEEIGEVINKRSDSYMLTYFVFRYTVPETIGNLTVN